MTLRTVVSKPRTLPCSFVELTDVYRETLEKRNELLLNHLCRAKRGARVGDQFFFDVYDVVPCPGLLQMLPVHGHPLHFFKV